MRAFDKPATEPLTPNGFTMGFGTKRYPDRANAIYEVMTNAPQAPQPTDDWDQAFAYGKQWGRVLDRVFKALDSGELAAKTGWSQDYVNNNVYEPLRPDTKLLSLIAETRPLAWYNPYSWIDERHVQAKASANGWSLGVKQRPSFSVCYGWENRHIGNIFNPVDHIRTHKIAVSIFRTLLTSNGDYLVVKKDAYGDNKDSRTLQAEDLRIVKRVLPRRSQNPAIKASDKTFLEAHLVKYRQQRNLIDARDKSEIFSGKAIMTNAEYIGIAPRDISDMLGSLLMATGLIAPTELTN